MNNNNLGPFNPKVFVESLFEKKGLKNMRLVLNPIAQMQQPGDECEKAYAPPACKKGVQFPRVPEGQ